MDKAPDFVSGLCRFESCPWSSKTQYLLAILKIFSLEKVNTEKARSIGNVRLSLPQIMAAQSFGHVQLERKL